ncbi:MAG: ABC transporter permease [Candidatus Nanopelagicales bacterium]|nr:ABC transporter permease [Candidatus Nanopelagicales bacterium]MDP4888568.1 ABC transporter permease [Candidatus Nanopelagicales bacterium]
MNTSMMLASAEIRRGRGRFASVVSALALIVFLVLVLGALADGLFFGATGAVRSTTANAYAFSSDAEGSLVRSRLDISDVAKFAQVPGVASAGPVGVLLTGGEGPEGELDLAVFGISMGAAGTPNTLVSGRIPEPGEVGVALADQQLDQFGVRIGTTVSVGGNSAEIVGIVSDTSYLLQPTIWTSIDTWRAMRDAVRPELSGEATQINAVALTTSADLGDIAAAVDGTNVLTAEATGLAIPGVEQQNATLNSIIYTTLAVSALVVALFFALLVLEKRELFASLKALGTPTSRLGWAVIIQAVVSSVLGVVIGSIVAQLFGLVIPASVPTLFRPETLITIGVFTVIAGFVGALFSLRRIARIDPATAIGGVL